jgi:predicted secreted Zn-dependent protease
MATALPVAAYAQVASTQTGPTPLLETVADVPVFVGPATLALSGGSGIHRWDELRFGANEVSLQASLAAGPDPCALWLVATDPTEPTAPIAAPAFTSAPNTRTTESLTLSVDYATTRLTVGSTCQDWALRFEPQADPALAQTLTEQNYPVRGTTIADVAPQTNQAKDGYAAYASWQTDWRFTWQDDGTSCTITSGEASLVSSIEYPRWRPPADADARDIAEWRRFIDRLTTHELGHITIALQGADAIDELFDSGISAPTCDEVERVANEAALALHERYNRLNARYDRETDHGVAQGSVLR